MRELTDRQREVLDYVSEHVADHGRAPTRGEITAALKYKRERTVCVVLAALEKKRYIKLTPGKHRGIEIIF